MTPRLVEILLALMPHGEDRRGVAGVDLEKSDVTRLAPHQLRVRRRAAARRLRSLPSTLAAERYRPDDFARAALARPRATNASCALRASDFMRSPVALQLRCMIPDRVIG